MGSLPHCLTLAVDGPGRQRYPCFGNSCQGKHLEKPPVYDIRTFRGPDSVGPLVALARKALADEFERELEPLALNVAQGVAILLLAGGRAATAADLCRSLSYDAGAMTRVVDKLEERGLVKRVRGTHDRRSARLELTREGKTMHAQVTRVQVDTLNRMLRGFTKSEARLLEALLRRIVENANGEDA